MQGGSWALVLLAPAQTDMLSHLLSWGSMAGQSKARGMAEHFSERGSNLGELKVERRDPPGRPATRSTAPYPIAVHHVELN
jgi:hypothetical protein